MGKRAYSFSWYFFLKAHLSQIRLTLQELLVSEGCHTGHVLPEQGQRDSCLLPLLSSLQSKYSIRQTSWCLVSHSISVSCCFLMHMHVCPLYARPEIKLIFNCLCDPNLRSINPTVKHQNGLSPINNGQMRLGKKEENAIED